MARSAIGLPSETPFGAAPRRYRLWLSREARLPPGPLPAAEPYQAPTLSVGTLTARELIAMARAARLGRQG